LEVRWHSYQVLIYPLLGLLLQGRGNKNKSVNTATNQILQNKATSEGCTKRWETGSPRDLCTP